MLDSTPGLITKKMESNIDKDSNKNLIPEFQERKSSRATNKGKSKKKPMKVVYISNPMKFNASASEFRALVQELTGQDAEVPDPTKFSGAEASPKAVDEAQDPSSEQPDQREEYGPSILRDMSLKDDDDSIVAQVDSFPSSWCDSSAHQLHHLDGQYTTRS